MSFLKKTALTQSLLPTGGTKISPQKEPNGKPNYETPYILTLGQTTRKEVQSLTFTPLSLRSIKSSKDSI